MNTTDPLDEMFPIVDKNDHVIGKTTRKDANSNPNIIHRATGAFIFNQNDELLIQKRSPTKDTFPDCWDISVGGHVEYGDDYLPTIIREVSEEIDVQINQKDLKLLGKVLVTLPWENEFWQVYLYDLKEEISIKANTEEVAETKYVSIDTLKAMFPIKPSSSAIKPENFSLPSLSNNFKSARYDSLIQYKAISQYGEVPEWPNGLVSPRD